MSSNLSRLFSSVPVPIPTTILVSLSSATLIASRFIVSSSSTQQPDRSREPVTEEEKRIEDEEENDEDEDEDEYVNKVTGEMGGPKGPEPTRYGDWERNGRCSDF